MSKKVILILRIVLYTAAVAVIYDTFFNSTLGETSQAIELKTFTQQASGQYSEYFIRLNDTGTRWIGFQTAPSLGEELDLGTESPWLSETSFWNSFDERDLTFVGFYLTSDLALDANSFEQIVKRLPDIKQHSDDRLSKITTKKEFTAIFLNK